MLMTKLRKDDRGFTLIELMMVIVILGILAGVAVPMMGNMRKNAWRAKLTSLADAVATAIIADGIETNAFPADKAALDKLIQLPEGVGVQIQTTAAVTDPDAFADTNSKAELVIAHASDTDTFQIQAYYPAKTKLFTPAKDYEAGNNLKNASSGSEL